MSRLYEYYESGNAPHEALGRAARKLTHGALYLGGGVGIEKQVSKQGDRYVVTRTGGKDESFAGPLSAAMRGFALAGGSTAADTPGGSAKVTDPAAAARLRELNDEERDLERRIARYEARLAAKDQVGTLPSSPQNTDWERRELAEDKSRLAQLRAERKRLIDTGKVEEAVEAGKPGTNWKQIGPAESKKLSPLVQHYRKMAHGFTQCVRDNTKRFGEERAKKICAVVKDKGRRSTKWRNGGEKKVREAVEEACARIETVDGTLGAGSAVELAELAGGIGDAEMDALGEQAFADLGLLFIAGHPLGETWVQVREGFEERLHPRDRVGKFRRKVFGMSPGSKAEFLGGAGVALVGPGPGKAGTNYVSYGPGRTRRMEHGQDANAAAERAKNLSLRSTDEKSLGGKKSLGSIEAAEREHGGKPKRVTRPLKDTTPGIADSPGESARDVKTWKNFERARGPQSRYAAEKLTPEQRAAGERRRAERANKSREAEGAGPTPRPMSAQQGAQDRVVVKRKLRKASPGETIELPNGTKVEKMSNGNYIANGHNVGPNLDRASEVAAAAERVKAKRAGRRDAAGGTTGETAEQTRKRAQGKRRK